MKLRTYLLLGSVLSSPIWAGAAFAADPPPTQQAGAVEEIVVTATRREEALSTVPISVTAVTEKDMDVKSMRGIEDIARDTPGIIFTKGFSSTTGISIRGVSSSGAGTTGIYIGDSPIQVRSVGVGSTNTYPLLFDVERVEVLRGPQGTLFGAGSEGGTIRFVTPTPSLTDTSGYARVEGSTIAHGSQSYEAGVAYGTPLVADKLGVRGSFWFQHQGGYVDKTDPVTNQITKKDFNTAESKVAKVDVRYAVTDNFTITPSFFFQEQQTADVGQYWEQYSNPKAGDFRSAITTPQPGLDRFKLTSLKMEYQGPGFDVLSNTSYFDRFNNQVVDYSTLIPAYFTKKPFVPQFPHYPAYANFDATQKVTTEELRVQSSNPTSNWKWLVGGYASLAKQTMFEHIYDPDFAAQTLVVYNLTVLQKYGMDVLPGNVIYDARDIAKDGQIAGFGEVSYKIFDTVTLTAGARYAKMTVSLRSSQTGPFNGGVTTQTVGSGSETALTPKFNISWQPDDDSLYYVTATKGFRPGGVNQSIPYTPGICKDDQDRFGGPAPKNYKSDSIWSYEAGVKDSFFDKRVYIAASVYYLDWQNKQLGRNACGLSYLDNSGTAKSEGFDLDARFLVTPDLTIGGTMGYIDAEYTASILASPNAAGIRIPTIAKGDSLVTQPWTFTANVQYNFIAFTRDAYFRADWERHSGYKAPSALNPATTAYSPDTLRPLGTNFVTARLGATFNAWDISLYAKNLFDSSTQLARFFDRINVFGADKAFTFQPRTVGLTGTTRF